MSECELTVSESKRKCIAVHYLLVRARSGEREQQVGFEIRVSMSFFVFSASAS